MSFRLVPKSVNLNDLERRNGVILRYFSEFSSFRAHCVKVHVRYLICDEFLFSCPVLYFFLVPTLSSNCAADIDALWLK